eukprot:m.136325 g.136325  ORF g.136325 m.136325 type:complete len:473 (+) comp38175_c0_seq6:929-2347(+)
MSMPHAVHTAPSSQPHSLVALMNTSDPFLSADQPFDWEDRLKGSTYDLSAFIRGTTHTPEDAIAEWLQQNFCSQQDVNAENTQNNVNEELTRLPPTFPSIKIKLDVTVTYKDMPLLLIQVDSSPYHETLIKTALFLFEHFRWLRNGDSTITEWSAFAFPNPHTLSCATQVDISWVDEKMQFKICFQPLCLADVERLFRQKHADLLSKMKDFKRPSEVLYGLPLSKNSLLENFENDPVQVPSNYSIVLLEGSDSLWKCPLDGKERDNLVGLHEKYKDKDASEKQYLLPFDSKVIHGKAFLRFPVLFSPLKREEAKRCLSDLARSVSKAVEQMHEQLKISHLDIGLENICFRCDEANCTATAVLIDLDGSVECDKPANELKFSGSGSTCQVPRDGFTAEMIDWRQFGIMLWYVENGIPEGQTYHAMEVSHEGDKLLKTLLEGNNPSKETVECFCAKHGSDESIFKVIKERPESS